MKMDLRKKLERKLGFKCKDNNRLSLLEKREHPFSLENISQVSNPITLIQSRIEVAEQKPFAKGKFTGAKLFTSIPTFLKRGKKDIVEPWPPKPPSNPSHQSSDELSPASPKAEYFRFIPSVTASDEATLADSVVSVNGSALEEMDKNKKNFEFEELLESDSTQRVSLTTQRLRSIESRRRLNNLKPRDSIHKKMDIMEEQSDEGESSTMSSPNSLNEHYTPVLKRSQTLYEFLKTSNPEGSRQSGPAPRVEPFGKLIPREPTVSFKSILRNGDSSSDEDELSSVEGAAKYTYKVARRSRRNSETLHDFLKNSKPEDVEAGNIGTKVNRTLSRAGTQLQRIHHSIRRSATTRGKVQHQENNNTSDLTQDQITASARRERRRRRGLSVPTVFAITRFPLDEHTNPSAEVMASPESVSTSATLAANLSSPSLSIPTRVRPFSVLERRNTSRVHIRRRDVSSLLLSSTSEVSTLPPGTPSNLSMMRSNGDSENPDLYFISNSSKTRASKRYSVATNPPEMVIPFCLCSECLNGMLQHF
ncbi:hypothetical protein K7432_011021 [Basidiobolus ranarum]|uniref:Uncharacterized protein n=1 Tax=Basidiobolus ranarum TaxID=34480 RepID=A0ABR2WMV5_9FUNG